MKIDMIKVPVRDLIAGYQEDDATSKVSAWKVSSWLDGPDYDGKYVVRILP